MNKEKSIYLASEGFLVIDGVEYVESITKIKKIDGIEHADKTLYKKFDRKGFEKKMDFIVEKIEFSLDKSEIIKHLLKNKALNEINKLYNVLKEDKKQKKKITIQKGCIGLKIGTGKSKTGGLYFQLID